MTLEIGRRYRVNEIYEWVGTLVEIQDNGAKRICKIEIGGCPWQGGMTVYTSENNVRRVEDPCTP